MKIISSLPTLCAEKTRKKPKPKQVFMQISSHIVKVLSDIYVKGVFLTLQENKTQHSL